jgi:high-affinity K+ transport system ATPase subunit B
LPFSARRLAVSRPVICQSGEVLSPGPVAGSLLVMETIRLTGAGSQLSVLTTFSVTNDVAKYFAIIPVLFFGIFPQLTTLNMMGLTSSKSAILSATIYNALIIIALIPLSLKGVKYKEMPAGELLKRNMFIYGLGGLIAPFIAIKAIDMILTMFGFI